MATPLGTAMAWVFRVFSFENFWILVPRVLSWFWLWCLEQSFAFWCRKRSGNFRLSEFGFSFGFLPFFYRKSRLSRFLNSHRASYSSALALAQSKQSEFSSFSRCLVYYTARLLCNSRNPRPVCTAEPRDISFFSPCLHNRTARPNFGVIFLSILGFWWV